MPNIFKRFMNPTAVSYVFPETSELKVEEETSAQDETVTGDGRVISGLPSFDEDGEPEDTEEAEEEQAEPSTPIDFAQVQADAILADARREAERIRAEALQAAEEELHALRREARADGYNAGFAEGMASAMSEGREEIEKRAQELEKSVKSFLESATRARDEIFEQTREGLRDLALAIAEKVIRVSLKSSGDILMRMIEAATEKHRRCEWVQIYIADCDAKMMSYTAPELNEALGHLSDRVRLIPMADDESGTCIIEMPDEIIDASVSTQMDNISNIVHQRSGEG